jgi:signal transduction histidine kinase
MGDLDDTLLSWVSGAGELTPKPLHRVSRDSPCGRVMELQRTEVFQRPERFYPSLQHNTFRFEELVAVPWQVPDGRVGTVWIASHDRTRHFDPEDLRLIESLTQFARLAMQRSGSEESRRSYEALTSAVRLANELAHEVNNPLQALMNSLYLVPLSFDNEHLLQASVQARRLTEAVQSVLRIKRADAPS